MIGFYGVKDYYYKGKHIGGIWHFLNTTRRFIDEHNYDKVVVFWDGEDSSNARKRIYPQYKENRKQHSGSNKYKEESFIEQKERVKSYLEEMFIRQITIDGCESDDAIAYYCIVSDDEYKTIFSSDKDLTQLISDKVEVYSPTHKKLYKNGDLIPLKEVSIPHYNIKTFKILSGDKSDNIDGIQLLGEKTFVKIFPEILDNLMSVDNILTRTKELLSEGDKRKILDNIVTGKTKRGVLGEQFFNINKKVVDLSNPMISNEGKEEVELFYKEELDPEGRGYQNLMRMMMNDGIFKYLPKQDDAWVEFLQPFMKLTRKEKKRFKTKN